MFRCADRDLVLAVGNDGQFAAFCRAAGRAELAADPRFRTNPDRVRNRAVLVPIVEVIMSARTCEDWLATLTAAGVPCGPINDLAEVFADPQVTHRGLRVEIPHPSGASCPGIASPMRFSKTPVEYLTPPPLLGQHTREVLTGILGLAESEIATLAAEGIV